MTPRFTALALSSVILGPLAYSQCELQKFHSSEGGTGFFIADVEGDLALSRTTSAVIFQRTPFGWTPVQELVPSDAPAFSPGDASLDGDQLAVGSTDR